MGGARGGMMPLHCGPNHSTRPALSGKIGPNGSFYPINRVHGSFELAPRCLHCPANPRYQHGHQMTNRYRSPQMQSHEARVR